jgi:hypothetical protein
MNKLKKLWAWYKALPKWKKIVYGIIGGIFFLIPGGLIALIIVFVDVSKPTTILNNGGAAATGKPNPSGTDKPNEADAKPIDDKLNSISEDLNKGK